MPILNKTACAHGPPRPGAERGAGSRVSPACSARGNLHRLWVQRQMPQLSEVRRFRGGGAPVVRAAAPVGCSILSTFGPSLPPAAAARFAHRAGWTATEGRRSKNFFGLPSFRCIEINILAKLRQQYARDHCLLHICVLYKGCNQVMRGSPPKPA